MTRWLLRAVAIGIAIAGLIDPAWTVSRPPAQKLVVIRATADPGAAPEQALLAALPGGEIELREAASRIPCGSSERCLVIADGSIDVNLPDDLTHPVALIARSAAADPNVSVRSVLMSGGHQHAAGVARIELSRTATVRESQIRILDGAAVVGSATHQWSGALSASLDVPWWPIGTGSRTLRVDVAPVAGELTTIDNHVDVGVAIGATRASVLVFDTRPSWSSTFVRRALEDDARFTVGYRARLAPLLSAGTSNGRLDTATLDLASVIVIGAPDALTTNDVVLLERFVNVRGGTLVLLPERPPSGPLARLLPGNWTEHLSAVPEAVGPLRATEVLRAERLPVTATVLARSGSAASIASIPSGDGRIVVAGAMDAWRYRDVDGRFDAFWRSLIAEGAEAGEGVQLTFDQPLAARGSRARFTIRDRRMAPSASSEASAVARCEAGPATTTRVWPAGPLGAFTGELPLAAAGSCTIEASINGRQATGSIAVAEQPAFGIEPTLAKLEQRVTSAGGTVVASGDEAALARALASSTLSPVVAKTMHPMRDAWWIFPFAACLSIEWWLRRRNGLR